MQPVVGRAVERRVRLVGVETDIDLRREFGEAETRAAPVVAYGDCPRDVARPGWVKLVRLRRIRFPSPPPCSRKGTLSRRGWPRGSAVSLALVLASLAQSRAFGIHGMCGRPCPFRPRFQPQNAISGLSESCGLTQSVHTYRTVRRLLGLLSLGSEFEDSSARSGTYAGGRGSRASSTVPRGLRERAIPSGRARRYGQRLARW